MPNIGEYSASVNLDTKKLRSAGDEAVGLLQKLGGEIDKVNKAKASPGLDVTPLKRQIGDLSAQLKSAGTTFSSSKLKVDSTPLDMLGSKASKAKAALHGLTDAKFAADLARIDMQLAKLGTSGGGGGGILAGGFAARFIGPLLAGLTATKLAVAGIVGILALVAAGISKAVGDTKAWAREVVQLKDALTTTSEQAVVLRRLFEQSAANVGDITGVVQSLRSAARGLIGYRQATPTEMLRNLGISFVPNVTTDIDLLDQLAQAFARMSETKRRAYAEGLFPGAADSVLKITAEINKFGGNISKAFKEGDLAGMVFAAKSVERLDNASKRIAGQWGQLKAQLAAPFVEFADEVLTWFNAKVESMLMRIPNAWRSMISTFKVAWIDFQIWYYANIEEWVKSLQKVLDTLQPPDYLKLLGNIVSFVASKAASAGPEKPPPGVPLSEIASRVISEGAAQLTGLVSDEDISRYDLINEKRRLGIAISKEDAEWHAKITALIKQRQVELAAEEKRRKDAAENKPWDIPGLGGPSVAGPNPIIQALLGVVQQRAQMSSELFGGRRRGGAGEAIAGLTAVTQGMYRIDGAGQHLIDTFIRASAAIRETRKTIFEVGQQTRSFAEDILGIQQNLEGARNQQARFKLEIAKGGANLDEQRRLEGELAVQERVFGIQQQIRKVRQDISQDEQRMAKAKQLLDMPKEDRLDYLVDTIVKNSGGTLTPLEARKTQEFANKSELFTTAALQQNYEVLNAKVLARIELLKTLGVSEELAIKAAVEAERQRRMVMVDFGASISDAISQVTTTLVEKTRTWKEVWSGVLKSMLGTATKTFADIVVKQGLMLEGFEASPAGVGKFAMNLFDTLKRPDKFFMRLLGMGGYPEVEKPAESPEEAVKAAVESLTKADQDLVLELQTVADATKINSETIDRLTSALTGGPGAPPPGAALPEGPMLPPPGTPGGPFGPPAPIAPAAAPIAPLADTTRKAGALGTVTGGAAGALGAARGTQGADALGKVQGGFSIATATLSALVGASDLLGGAAKKTEAGEGTGGAGGGGGGGAPAEETRVKQAETAENTKENVDATKTMSGALHRSLSNIGSLLKESGADFKGGFAKLYSVFVEIVGLIATLVSLAAGSVQVFGTGRGYHGGIVGHLPRFQTGGVPMVLPRNVSGIGGGMIPIMAHEGEGILRRAAVDRLGGARAIHAINRGEPLPTPNDLLLAVPRFNMPVPTRSGGVAYAPQVTINGSTLSEQQMRDAINGALARNNAEFMRGLGYTS